MFKQQKQEVVCEQVLPVGPCRSGLVLLVFYFGGGGEHQEPSGCLLLRLEIKSTQERSCHVHPAGSARTRRTAAAAKSVCSSASVVFTAPRPQRPSALS